MLEDLTFWLFAPRMCVGLDVQRIDCQSGPSAGSHTWASFTNSFK